MTAERFAGVALGAHVISFEGQSGALPGVRAYVEEDGEVVRRVTSAGPASLSRLLDVLRGQEHPREVFLIIEGRGFQFIVPCDPAQRLPAREFAAAVNAAGARPASEPVRRPAGPGFARDVAPSCPATDRSRNGPWPRWRPLGLAAEPRGYL
jgi:hypothetical protein